MDIGLLIVYFFYGLAFFGMGLTMALETGRSPSLAEVRLLRPLAFFGLLHGLHEWMEIFLLQSLWMGIRIADWIEWLRLGLLVLSFAALSTFGIQAFRLARQKAGSLVRLLFLSLAVYLALISFSALSTYVGREPPWLLVSDALTRYLVAAPAAALAASGLYFQSQQARAENRQALADRMNWAAAGFALYGLTQIFVPSTAMAPALWLNAEFFRNLTGIPIQAIRSLAAGVIAYGLFRATQVVENERQSQLETAQSARLEALEQVKEELAKRERLQRELLRHTVQAQEDERARIARELHDETAQVLTAFSLDLAALQNLIPDRPEVGTLAERLQSYGRQISQGLYRLVHDLRPAQLDTLGLVPAIEFLLDQECCPKNLEAAFNVQGNVRRLDETIETVLFRVAQEALNNVWRHAQTQEVQVEVIYASDQVTLRVQDAGIGFDPEASFVPPRGWGLAGMRERVEALAGRMYIRSTPGKGTIVEAVIPVDTSEGVG